MTATALPEGLDADLVRRQHLAVDAWRAELTRRVEQARTGDLTDDEQQALKGWLRARAAVDACLARHARGEAPRTGAGPRAVVAHRERSLGTQLEDALTRHGLRVAGGGKDAAVALAMAVVEQPDLLLVDDDLPGSSTVELLGAVRRFAPATAVVVRAGGSTSAAPALLLAGASAVLSRQLAPDAVGASCAELVSPALRGDVVAG